MCTFKLAALCELKSFMTMISVNGMYSWRGTTASNTEINPNILPKRDHHLRVVNNSDGSCHWTGQDEIRREMWTIVLADCSLKMRKGKHR